MPYVLNVLVVGEGAPEQLCTGVLVAELDSPAEATLVVGDRRFQGTRYLIMSDDETNYRSGMKLVSIPSDVDQSATLNVDLELRSEFRSLLLALMGRSPQRELVLYLEANRIISRPDPTEEFPVTPKLHSPVPLGTLLHQVEEGALVEHEVFVARGEVLSK